jgi:hypothetical protein
MNINGEFFFDMLYQLNNACDTHHMCIMMGIYSCMFARVPNYSKYMTLQMGLRIFDMIYKFNINFRIKYIISP